MTTNNTIISADAITVNGIKYVPENSARATQPSGNRAIVVITSGWVYCGDIVRKNGRIYLSRVVWLFRWESIGLDGVIANPKSPKVNLRPFSDIDIPEHAELYAIPVSENWGL